MNSFCINVGIIPVWDFPKYEGETEHAEVMYDLSNR